ncbi:MAG: AMP-binding protein [Comamonadaceae bacterium]|nr:AMP-binding protein [Comamonadaceae bacterium]
MGPGMSSNQIVWQPKEALVCTSNLARFFEAVGISGAGVEGYNELVARSAENPEWLWEQVIKFYDLQFYHPYERILDTTKGAPWAEWCVGGTTNLVLNCLDKYLDTPTWNKAALVWEGEDGRTRQWTYSELAAETSRLAEGLRSLGMGRGDVIGLYMPMIPEAAAALLAIAKIGGIVLPLFSGFGSQAIVSRLQDGGAVGVITSDGTWRRGKMQDMKATMDEAAKHTPGIRHVVVVRNTGGPVSWDASRDHWWHEICDGQPIDSPTEAVSADSPVMLVHTSGTTGKPKGTVHTHCGFSMKMALDMGLVVDYRATDRLMWMSDFGWVVGPILVVSSLLVGATMIMAEGAPDYPDKGRFWRLIQDNQVSILGIAPTIVRSFIKAGGSGVEDYDLSSLRVTVSTGEPWTPDAWTWMFEKVCKKAVPILNYSGGTEIGGAIVSGTVLHPMKPCAFSGPVPGMGADVVDENGISVGRGGEGELVLRQPSPGLTRGLWHDPERYIESYWTRYPGIWWHGDRASIDEDGFWYIHGRSDDTLKIAGKRTGPAEVEMFVMATGKIAEVAAVGVPDDVKGESILLVATPMPGVVGGTDLEMEIAEAVVAGLGTPFRPTAVLFVPDLPKTRNMKIMRRVVRATVLGQVAGDLSSLVNPECIDHIAVAAAGLRAASQG